MTMVGSFPKMLTITMFVRSVGLTMTTKINGIVVITDEKPQQCDLCGKIAELRPYGPNGECICFECGEKDPESVERAMGKLFGA